MEHDMFSLNQVKHKIWHLNFESGKDLSLHFCKISESQKASKNEWVGFNVPGQMIFDLSKRTDIEKNIYDMMMISLAEYIKSKEKSKDFYIIGTSSDDSELNITFNHELAHSLFAINKRYRDQMTSLFFKMPKNIRTFVFKKLRDCGYEDEILLDEAQAYLATGLYDTFDKPRVRKYKDEFEYVFRKFGKQFVKLQEENP